MLGPLCVLLRARACPAVPSRHVLPPMPSPPLQDGWTPLHFAASLKFTAVARLLLADPRVDANPKDEVGDARDQMLDTYLPPTHT